MKHNYSYQREYLLRDGEPWFPVMGEFHFSRYREDLWEESLQKMKAGGVTIVSTYVFWNHHEEVEGKFRFEGCRNLRKFVALCEKVGLPLILRIGPWCHGEARNGGFPDWLVEKQIPLRRNDEQYLAYVERFWEKIAEQVQGKMQEVGGPVIGIQIENEYGHAGGYGGEVGEQHIRTLTSMAKKLGFRTPYYTATGWGGAVIGDLLPVMGGYCEAPWDPRLTELEANDNYVFNGNRNDENIASDYKVEDSSQNLTFSPEDYPYLTAELGGGLQVTWNRRPVATGQDIGAMSLTKLGSGVELLGYYMYHGGSNPKGELSTLQESKASGGYCDLPEINYDFNAPLRQYGQISDTYREIKLLALFLKDFGEDMAVLPSEIIGKPISPENMEQLRSACRHDDTHGYIFVNNYQRRREMKGHENVILTGICKKPVTFPAIDISSGEYFFFPYRMKLGESTLISALATPLCKLKQKEGTCYVFYGDRQPQFQWERKAEKVLHLCREDALNAYKITLDQDYLVISEGFVWEEEGNVQVYGGQNMQIKTFPSMEIPGFVKMGQEGLFTIYERAEKKTQDSRIELKQKEKDADGIWYEAKISYGKSIKDCLVSFSYQGDGMRIFHGEEMINDYFYTGQKAQISMRYFNFPEKLQIYVRKLRKDQPVYLEKWPEMPDGEICTLNGAEILEQI